MRPLLLTFGLAVSTAVHGAIPVPDRPITDPRSVTSPANSQAMAVPVEDLAIGRGVYDAAWSVDGKQVFISTNLTGRFNIWRVDSSGSWPAQLTVSDEGQNGLSPSPDGRTLLFTQDAGGNEYYDVYSVPVSGGAVTQLTATFVTLADTVPLPLVTVQVCAGFEGCVCTVTA